jgi:hypothetical protein
LSAEEIMEILEAYDLTGSLRDAGELVGRSHHTVGRGGAGGGPAGAGVAVGADECGRSVPACLPERLICRPELADPVLAALGLA